MLRSLDQVPAIREVLTGLESSPLEELAENTDELPGIRPLIGKAITDDPPAKVAVGCLKKPYTERQLKDAIDCVDRHLSGEQVKPRHGLDLYTPEQG
jgi:hypothetical protein